ncbi:IS3 family transposase, partial [Lacticaseibacillus manihotivorans]
GRADKFLDFGYDVIMYSNEDKLRAVKLFHQYDRAWAHVLRELGYPSRSALKLWVRQYAKDPHVFEIRNRGKYSKEQQTTAVNYYFEHGRSSARAVRTLGFPSRSLLDLWVRKDSRFASVQPVASDQVHHPTKTKHTLPKTAPMRIAKLEKAHSDKLELNASTEKLSSLSHDELLHRAQDLELQNDILLQVNALLKKDLGIDHLNLTNREKTHVIDALRDKYALKTLLTALGLSKSSYFYQVEASAKGDKYASVRPLLHIIFKQSYESYGYRRMQDELKDEGIQLSEKVIRRLMVEEGLVVTITRCRKYSSYAGEITPAVPNVLDRDFSAKTPNQKLVTDITEFSIQAGKVYLSPLIDCFDGQITSWRIGTSPNAELVNTMLESAAQALPAHAKPTVHSDRGAHYRWPGWIELMDKYGFIRSMSKKGCTPDNAQAESFFGHLKTEFFYNRSWIGISLQDFIQELDRYIEWYNTKRRKKVLGGKSP